MSLGEAQHGLESADGSPVTILQRGGETVALVRDPEARALLNSLLMTQEQILEAVQELDARVRRVPVVHVRPCVLKPAPPSAIAVDTSGVTVVVENLARRGLELVNTSGARISLGLGYAAVLDSGITIAAGGTWTMGVEDFFCGTIYAIASAGASNLGIQEFS